MVQQRRNLQELILMQSIIPGFSEDAFGFIVFMGLGLFVAFLLAVLIIMLLGMLLPKNIQKSISIFFSRKHRAVIIKKKIRKSRYKRTSASGRDPKIYVDEAAYFSVDLSINGQVKTYYCRSLQEFNKLPVHQEIIVYVSGKSIILFEKLQ